MSLKHVLEVMDAVDSPSASGADIREVFARHGWDGVSTETGEGTGGSTDFVKAVVPGSEGKASGGDAPTLGVVGRLGGLGARPEAIGYVSDGDGAVAALSAALKLADMRLRGDVLAGDVILATHVCPDAPTRPHDPVPFMDSPVDMATMNEKEIDAGMDAVLSIDTTKGNRLVNHRGIAISPPVKEGWILRLTDGLLDIYQSVTGHPPVILPLTMQDVTPYGNGVHHVNSIVQPATATVAPVLGVAITAESVVPGSATGASREADIALAVNYAIEVAKLFGQGRLDFYDDSEFERLVRLYGSMKGLQGAEQ
jgi:Protein of unknown function (DUF1177)